MRLQGLILHNHLERPQAAAKSGIIIKYKAPTIDLLLLAPEYYPCTYGALPRHKLLEIHHSKISLHYAKEGYNYPTIRLPHTFSKLAGLPARIYQTVHQGALAFLVVVSPRPDKGGNKRRSTRVFTRRGSSVRIRPSLLVVRILDPFDTHKKDRARL
jgi:hypothetical protein